MSDTTTNNVRVKSFQKFDGINNPRHGCNRLWNSLLFYLLINNILGKIIASFFKGVSHDILVYLSYYEVDKKSKEKVFE